MGALWGAEAGGFGAGKARSWAVGAPGKLCGRLLSSAKARANRDKALRAVLGLHRRHEPLPGRQGLQGIAGTATSATTNSSGVGGKADQTTRDAMDLAPLTDQWPADVLKIERSDIHDGALWIVQNKTKSKRAIEITGEVGPVDRADQRQPRERPSAYLIQDDDGRPLGAHGLRSRFDKARRLAGVEFQFRDIRAKARPTRVTWRIHKSC